MAKLNLVEAINLGLKQEMKRDKNVIILGEDVGKDGGVFRVTDGLQKIFGEKRVFDTPLCESGIVGTSIGMAVYGLRPVCEIQFEGFIMPAFNTFVNYYIPLENSKERATILSFAQMFLCVLLIIFYFPSNKPQETVSAAGWMLPAGVVIVVAILIHVLMRRYYRKNAEIKECDTVLEGESIS